MMLTVDHLITQFEGEKPMANVADSFRILLIKKDMNNEF